MKKIIAASLLNIVFICLPGQNSVDFTPPMDIPLFLSGSFGELRTSGFHSGVDFRTQGVTRKNVFAVEDGYISRIRIQTGGYGKALYIDHPEGFTSVYGHLDDFNEVIDLVVKNYQYNRQTHTLDLFPEKGKIPVKKGEFIAFSGNTGSSSGPHLHFEMRETSGQIPFNIMLLDNFKIIDRTKPVLYTLAVYPADSMSQVNSLNTPAYLTLERTGNGFYQIQSNQTVRISGKAGLGIEAYDFVNEGSLRCGIFSIELQKDDKTIYHFEADKFSFSETRYLNAHIDYPYFMKKKMRINLLYRKPNNLLSMYKTIINDGIIQMSAGDKAEIKIMVKDAAGNESSLLFPVEGTALNPLVRKEKPEHTAVFSWSSANRFSGNYSELIVPRGALYEDIFFNYSMNETTNSIYPYIHFVHDSLTPLHLPATLRLNAEGIPDLYREKTVIVKLNGNQKRTSSGGKWEGKWIFTNINAFGVYSLDVDTLPPVIQPLNISHGKDMTSESSIRFNIDDNLTGISSYSGYINNNWVLFEYDPKDKLLFYTFDKKRLHNGMKHELEVYITDGVGNKSIYHTSFIW